MVSIYKPQSIEGMIFIIVVKYAVVFGGTDLHTLVGCLVYLNIILEVNHKFRIKCDTVSNIDLLIGCITNHESS